MRNIIEQVEFLCAHHHCAMELQHGRYSLYRRCSAYCNGGYRCGNALSVKDCSSIYDALRVLADEKRIGLYQEYREGHLKFAVIKMDENVIQISVINMKHGGRYL